jgi:hypothetical protein
MHRLLTGLILSLGFVAAAAAQGPIVPKSPTPPQPATTTRETKVPVTVQGCVFDRRLKITPVGVNSPALALVNGDEVVLEGTKELMQQLKKYHDGHEEQISGILTIPPNDDRDALTSVKRVGSKTTITASGSQDSKRDEKQPDQPKATRFLRLKIEEVKHVQNKCTFPV